MAPNAVKSPPWFFIGAVCALMTYVGLLPQLYPIVRAPPGCWGS